MGVKLDEKIDFEEIIKSFYENNQLEVGVEKYDRKLRDLDNKIEKWISQFSEEHRNIFLSLFTHLKYFDRENITEWYCRAYEEYKKIEPDYKDTVFIPVCSFGGVMNGAIHMLEAFDNADLDIPKKRSAPQPIEFYHAFDIKSVKNIVLLDDIVGSGDTIIDFILRYRKETPELFLNKNIYIFSVVSLERGKQRVETDLNYLGYKNSFITKYVIQKAFGSNTIFKNDKERSQVKKIVKSYEEQIAPKKHFIMGYKGGEALVAFYFNTPNNTLATFWESCENKPWFSIFPRKKDGDEFELRNISTLNEIREERKKTRELAKSIGVEVEKEKKLRRVKLNE